LFQDFVFINKTSKQLFFIFYLYGPLTSGTLAQVRHVGNV